MVLKDCTPAHTNTYWVWQLPTPPAILRLPSFDALQLADAQRDTPSARCTSKSQSLVPADHHSNCTQRTWTETNNGTHGHSDAKVRLKNKSASTVQLGSTQHCHCRGCAPLILNKHTAPRRLCPQPGTRARLAPAHGQKDTHSRPGSPH